MIGKIHSIDTFSTVDGPGIRCVAFMQGCPLKCKYCHNKDVCLFGIGKDYTPEQLIDELMKYKTYYNLSGGGITLSGGEPFAQPKFLLEVLKLAKEKGLHTCIDTSGFVDLDVAKPILEYVDLVLLDIKHIDLDKCVELTGKSPIKTMMLAEYLNYIDKPVWIRHVLVPGITDDEIDLLRLGQFLKGLKNVQDIEILKYHTLGAYKWKELGFKYELENVREATDEDIERALNIINKQGER